MLTLTLVTLFALYLIDRHGKWRVVYNRLVVPVLTVILTVIALCLLMAVWLGALDGLMWLVSEKISDPRAALFVFTAVVVAAAALFWRMYGRRQSHPNA